MMVRVDRMLSMRALLFFPIYKSAMSCAGWAIIIINNMYKVVVRDGRQAQHHDKRMEGVSGRR